MFRFLILPATLRLFVALALIPAGMSAASAQAAAPGITMDVAGRNWVASRTAVYRTMVGKAFALNINGFLDGPKVSRLSFTITPPAEGDYAHSYVLKPATPNFGGFNVDMVGGNVMESGFTVESGEFVVSKYDAAKKTISGTFSGKLKNHSGAATIEISNGRFTDVVITP